MTSPKVEAAVSWAVGIANDDTYGYDQVNRWGEYDCSSLVISAFEQAGIPVKTKGAIYTGNMRQVFLDCGFEDVTASVYLPTGAGLQRGDVLIRHDYISGDGHTAIALGDGNIVHASGNEFGGAVGGQPGDQTGREICVRPYYNSSPSWLYVLRYTADDGAAPEVTATSEPAPIPAPCLVALPELYKGCGIGALEYLRPAVIKLQLILNYELQNEQHFSPLELDGEFGDLTGAALETVQRYHSLTPDRICGPLTYRSIMTE